VSEIAVERLAQAILLAGIKPDTKRDGHYFDAERVAEEYARLGSIDIDATRDEMWDEIANEIVSPPPTADPSASDALVLLMAFRRFVERRYGDVFTEAELVAELKLDADVES
jgi:hypothetical protein